MRHLAPVAAVLTLAASLSALDRASRRYLAGAAAFVLGASALICGGVSVVSLVGGLVAAAGSITMARTGRAAGA
jgi:hypothetical protein